MALAVTRDRQTVVGDLRMIAGKIDFDSSYPTNGEVLTANDIGFFQTVDLILVSPTSGVIFEYDYTNSKLKAFFPTGGSGTPATGLGVPLLRSGAVAVTANAATAGIAPGVGAEVANTQDLSTLTGCKFVAFGK